MTIRILQGAALALAVGAVSSGLTFAAPEWSLERAAEEMVAGGFRHLVVVDGGELAGIVSMRDIVRVWVTEGATSEMPARSR